MSVLNQFKGDFKTDKFYIANASGDGYADALVASAIAGKYSAPLVLADIYGADTTNAVKKVEKSKTKSNYDTAVDKAEGSKLQADLDAAAKRFKYVEGILASGNVILRSKV